MTSKVIKTRSGYKMQFRDENGKVIKLGRIHVPPDLEAQRRSRLAVQEVLRHMFEEQQAAKV